MLNIDSWLSRTHTVSKDFAVSRCTASLHKIFPRAPGFPRPSPPAPHRVELTGIWDNDTLSIVHLAIQNVSYKCLRYRFRTLNTLKFLCSVRL